MANIFERGLSAVKNAMQPTYAAPVNLNENPKNLGTYISPVQLLRVRSDMQTLKDSMTEMESAWYPHRVKAQRIYNDTILGGQTYACMEKRLDLSLLREWSFVDEKGNENEDLKKLFNKKWFGTFLKYALQAKFFGYSLIALNEIQNDEFKSIKIVRRWNVSPDRLNVTQFVYSLSGAQFMEEPFKNWHVYVKTDSDVGASDCGYGLLYNVAIYDILSRNLLGNNADAAELFGMPIRKGKTQKTDEGERQEFMNAMLKMGSAGAILLDAFDELELVESSGAGQGFKIYPDFEKRLEAKITKIFLGHADALDSTPGKLGSGDGEQSPAYLAMMDKQAVDGAFLEEVVNGELVPKMIALGFIIDTKFKFKFSNNQELIQKRKYEDEANDKTADIIYKLYQSGWKVEDKYITERTGIPVTEIVTPLPLQKLSEPVKNKLAKIYNKHNHG